MTLDGKIAAFDRRSQWITGEAARHEGHRLRSQSDAIVTGIGTVLADDPALTCACHSPGRGSPTAWWWTAAPASRSTRSSSGPGAGPASWWRSGRRHRHKRLAALDSAGVTVLACKSREGRVDVVDLGARLLALDVTACCWKRAAS